jgi:hypothetical protein
MGFKVTDSPLVTRCLNRDSSLHPGNAGNVSVTGIDLKTHLYSKPEHEVPSVEETRMPCPEFDLRTSQRKKHACLARDSILLLLPAYPRPPISDRRGQAPPLASCLRWFQTTPSVDARSRRRDVLAPSRFIHVATGPRDQQQTLRGKCRRFVFIREHFLITISCCEKAKWQCLYCCLFCCLIVLLNLNNKFISLAFKKVTEFVPQWYSFYSHSQSVGFVESYT